MHILLADDQPKVRFAMRVLLERQPGMVVAGEVANADDLLTQLTAECPELVLLSWELPGLMTAGSVSALRATCPGLAVIALSGRPEACRLALAAGADAFVSKSDPPECLLAAIQAESKGKPTGESNSPSTTIPSAHTGADLSPQPVCTRTRDVHQPPANDEMFDVK